MTSEIDLRTPRPRIENILFLKPTGGKVKGTAKSRLSRAGLQFPLEEIHRFMEYYFFELGGNSARESKKSTIILVIYNNWKFVIRKN